MLKSFHSMNSINSLAPLSTMEPVSLAISVASLAPLLQTALDCFQHIRLSKSFGKDFEICRLRLDSIQLRLSRWGQATGLGSDTARMVTLENGSIAEENQKAIKTRLGQIISLFEDVEKVSRSLSTTNGEQNDSEELETMAESSTSIHQRVLEICHRRQKHTSQGKKTKWALYKRDHLTELINNLQILVNDLIELFPAALNKQRELCDEEADELREEADLPLLRTVAEERDLPLAEALDRLAKRGVRTSLRKSNVPAADSEQATAATYITTRNENSHIRNQVTGTQNISGGMTFN
jgi:hypothetical protein